VIKLLIFTYCVASANAALIAQTPDWHPSSGHTQIPIWPGKPPDAVPYGREVTTLVQSPGEPPATVVVRFRNLRSRSIHRREIKRVLR
jgi:hypothetical protein